MTFEKKVYTMEDNVKSISFGIKDLVKQLEDLNSSIAQVVSLLHTSLSDEKKLPFIGDEKEMPF